MSVCECTSCLIFHWVHLKVNLPQIQLNIKTL